MSRVKITIKKTLRMSAKPDDTGRYDLEALYTVIKTVNTLQVQIGQELSLEEIGNMIYGGADDITIVGALTGVRRAWG